MAGEKRDRSPASRASSDESRGHSPRDTSSSPVRNSSSALNSKPSNDPAEKNAPKRGKSLSVDVCKDFTKGRCKRLPLDCKYAHPSSAVAVEENKVTVCFDSLRDRCLRGISCRYYHPSPRIRVSLQEAAGIQPTTVPLGYQVDAIRSSNLFFGPPGVQHPLPVLSPPPLKTTNKLSVEVCRDYIRGRCSREADECRYAHHAPTDGQGEHVTVCADYLRGKCERNSCRYFHAPDHLRSRIRDAPVEPAATFNSVQYNLGMDNPYAFHPRAYDEQSVKRMKTIDYADEYFPRGLASQQYEAPLFQVPAISGPQFVPPPVLRFSESVGKQTDPPINDEDRLPVCRDYQKSKCSRDSSCKYAHPEPHTQVTLTIQVKEYKAQKVPREVRSVLDKEQVPCNVTAKANVEFDYDITLRQLLEQIKKGKMVQERGATDLDTLGHADDTGEDPEAEPQIGVHNASAGSSSLQIETLNITEDDMLRKPPLHLVRFLGRLG